MAKILVTGASGGFGGLTVSALVGRGHDVVATVRDAAGRNRKAADELRSLGARVVEMDVTSDGSVQSAISSVGELDVVVNNAGVGVLGFQEAFTPDDWKKIFDVNVFGVQRVNRAVLPAMRARGRGLLLHVSSLLGRFSIPFYGPYVASKWALEALAESYRVELSALGVDVAIVEPGGYATSFMSNLVKPSDGERSAGYASVPLQPQPFFEGFEAALAANPAQKPQDVADAIVRVIETPAGRRTFRTVVDQMGMGAAIAPYNEHLARLTAGLYGAFHMDQLLQLKS